MTRRDEGRAHDDEPYYTVAELARIVQMSERTIRNKIHSGELRAYRWDRMYRIRHSDADDWIDGHATT
jgi:excisionase family DNA binding protein